MKLSNKTYDVLKWVTITVLPALAVAYRALAQTWSLPMAEEIPTTIMVVQLFCATVLGISSASYKKEN